MGLSKQLDTNDVSQDIILREIIHLFIGYGWNTKTGREVFENNLMERPVLWKNLYIVLWKTLQKISGMK